MTGRVDASDPGPMLAGLPRLLGRPDLAQGADAAALQRAVDERFEALATGLLEEIAASDDVHDTDSARDYLEGRLRDLARYLSAAQVERLRADVLQRVAAW